MIKARSATFPTIPCRAHVPAPEPHCWHADDLDTRLLRAMVIKGILEQITTSTVNLVNADLLAKNRGLRIRETFVSAEGKVWRSCAC